MTACERHHTGKRDYRTKREALRSLRRMQSLRRNFPDEKRPRRVYKCDGCGWWYLTSQA